LLQRVRFDLALHLAHRSSNTPPSGPVFREASCSRRTGARDPSYINVSRRRVGNDPRGNQLGARQCGRGRRSFSGCPGIGTLHYKGQTRFYDAPLLNVELQSCKAIRLTRFPVFP